MESYRLASEGIFNFSFGSDDTPIPNRFGLFVQLGSIRENEKTPDKPSPGDFQVPPFVL